MTDDYLYADGNLPEVGDLIEFGTQHSRYLVTSIYGQGNGYLISCGSVDFKSYSLASMILIARHGEPERRK